MGSGEAVADLGVGAAVASGGAVAASEEAGVVGLVGVGSEGAAVVG